MFFSTLAFTIPVNSYFQEASFLWRLFRAFSHWRLWLGKGKDHTLQSGWKPFRINRVIFLLKLLDVFTRGKWKHYFPPDQLVFSTLVGVSFHRFLAKMSGQTISDRLLAARHSIAGQGLAKAVCKATTEEVIGPKKKHLDCKHLFGL